MSIRKRLQIRVNSTAPYLFSGRRFRANFTNLIKVQEKCQSASDKNRLQINSQTLVRLVFRIQRSDWLKFSIYWRTCWNPISYSLLKSTVFKLFVDNLYNHESPKMSHRSLTTKLDILLREVSNPTSGLNTCFWLNSEWD